MNTSTEARILIVDDEAAHMQALCNALRDRGYYTKGCLSGAQALTVLQSESFDLLLTDLMMPDMDGVALLRASLKLDPYLACVLMTGLGTIETAVKAMQAGAQDYILKPFKVSTLLPVITRALKVRQLRLENFELKNTVAIHELNEALAHTLDPKLLVEKIADAAAAQFDADEVLVLLAVDAETEAGRELELVAVRGEGRGALLGSRVPIDPALTGMMADTGDNQTALSIPMITGNQLVGMLRINCRHHQGAFAAGQIKALTIFTNAAAAGIQAARAQDAQLKADGRYREILNMVADAIISCDENQRILVFNEGAQTIFGYSAEEVLGKALEDLLPTTTGSNLFGRHRNGNLFPVETGISTRKENGRQLHTAVIRDITKRLQQEDRIARLTRLYAVLSGVNATIVRSVNERDLFQEICTIAVEHGKFTHAWIASFDPATCDLAVVAAAGAATLQEALDQQGLARQAARQSCIVWDNDLAVAATPGLQQGKATTARSGAALPFLVEGSTIGIMLLYSDAADAFGDDELALLRELAGDVEFALDHITKTRRVAWLATYDPLTGLPNRTLFMDRLAQAMASARDSNRPLAVVLVDIERFRHINATFGRQIGDELLRQLAGRLLAHTGGSQALARIGPDIFAMLNSSFVQASDMVKAVRALLELLGNEPYGMGAAPLRLALRAGIALFPADGNDADTLLKNAEAALERAKAEHEKLVLYTADLNARVAERLALESKLRGALERKEFILHYQPKIDLATGKVTGLEALLRWQDPELGLVFPDQFIGLLEEMGLILDVGTWVMQEAVRTSALLRSRGFDVRIAVNVSPTQLRDSTFVNSVADAIALVGNKPHGLDLEITESVIMHDLNENIRKLDLVRDMLVGVAIDDFGTGYSSLAYIARLPVALIKIDRAFINNLGSTAESVAIVQTIIALTHVLNMKVIAEGVETLAQATLLQELGCDYVQGYLYSRPVPLDGIAALLGTGLSVAGSEPQFRPIQH